MRTAHQLGVMLNAVYIHIDDLTPAEIAALEGEANTMATNEETIAYMDRYLPGTREPLIVMTRAIVTIWRASVEYRAAMLKVYKL